MPEVAPVPTTTGVFAVNGEMLMLLPTAAPTMAVPLTKVSLSVIKSMFLVLTVPRTPLLRVIPCAGSVDWRLMYSPSVTAGLR